MPNNETPLWLFIMLIIITILICTKSFAKEKHWCGDNMDNPPKHGHIKNINRADVVWEQGFPADKIKEHRCTETEYIAKWGPKRVEYYKTEDGEIVRGIWTLSCCAYKDGMKYPHWSWWRER